MSVHRATRLIVVSLALALCASGCSKEARQTAEFATYHAMLGMELGQVENTGYPLLAAQLGEAHKDPTKRESVLAGFRTLVDDIEAVVERHAPDDPANHVGYQAAMVMVDKRRAAVGDLAQAWEKVNEPTDDVQAPVRFGDAWMKAGFEFQSKVGEQSQKVFGGAAQKAHDGALEQAGKAARAPIR